MPLDLATVTRATFSPLLDTVFLLQREGARPLPLTLREVSDLPIAPTAPRRPFLLRFLSADPGALPQQIYALNHPALGTLEIFLVPAGPLEGRMRYDAVFG